MNIETYNTRQGGVDYAEKYRYSELLLNKLNSIGIALSIEKEIGVLLENILVAAKDMTNAEGGTIYLYKQDTQELSFEIMLNDVLKTHFGGTGKAKPPFPTIHVFDGNGKVNESMIAAYCAGYKTKVNVEDAYTQKGFDFSGTKKFDSQTGYRSRSFLTTPMVDAKEQLLGVLQLINPRDKDNNPRTFNEFDETMVESLTSQASVALSNRLLLDSTKNLFESMIKIINLALDEKSPYTNEHCKKVPIITMMIADAVIKNDRGALKDFYLDEDGKYELKIAALLHDCGKIVTPVHVIDKSKKLELLTDRIDVVEMKGDIIAKELQLKYKTSTKDGKKEYQNQLQQLKKDLSFLRVCDYGGESLSDESINRINQIANDWHYKDKDGKKHKLLTPEEIEMLSIRKGTLSASERQVINYHVSASIKMLESLPWPDNLKKVPEYAGGHHERVDGKGYPKGLTGAQMSVPAKMMAIADIFEALTASNRPYKQPKKLSEALDILDQLCLSGHIDPDVYEVFIREKVYLAYANEYLPKKQIDVVDHKTLKANY